LPEGAINAMNIEPRDVDSLIELFESSEWDELHLKIQDFELFLSRDPNAKSSGAAPPMTAPPPLPFAANPATSAAEPAAGGALARDEPAAAIPANWVAVTAPNLGTFYRSPKPGSPAFVEIGQAVSAETEICLIEVMKLFTTLKAGVKGTIRQVCVKDAAMVEYGDTLFYIEPA
jgi:acetyl-CoA carboxylase biotin carboxyl carrier protein